MMTRARVAVCSLFVLGISGTAYPEDRVSFLVGGMYSHGREARLAPYVETRLTSGSWRFSGKGDSGLGLDAERSLGPVLLTMTYRYRNGRETKGSVWAGAGVRCLVVRQEIAGENGTTSATVTLVRGPVEWQGAVYRYRPTFGGEHRFGSTVLLAFRY